MLAVEYCLSELINVGVEIGSMLKIPLLHSTNVRLLSFSSVIVKNIAENGDHAILEFIFVQCI